MPHVKLLCESFTEFDALHRAQLLKIGLPETFWNILFCKLTNQVFDTRRDFKMVKLEDNQMVGAGVEDSSEGNNQNWKVVVDARGELLANQEKNVYLIPHVWSYKANQARQDLEDNPELLQRMLRLMELEEKEAGTYSQTPFDDCEDDVEKVLQAMWGYNHAFDSNGIPETDVAEWYIMEELGCRIQHCDNPNMKTAPFYFLPLRQLCTVMWPLNDLTQGEEITRNYLSIESSNSLMKKIRMLPWQPEDMTHLSYENFTNDLDSFFNHMSHESMFKRSRYFEGLPKDRNPMLFIESQELREMLSDVRFDMALTPDDADIMWLDTDSVHDKPNKRAMVNHFPGDNLLSHPALMAQMMRQSGLSGIDPRTLKSRPDWFPTTFDLSKELSQFVSYFQNSNLRDVENYWLCRPWQPEGSGDGMLTNNLSCILRMQETAPQVVQKYVADPVLLDWPAEGMLKFDLTYVVLVHSLEPVNISSHPSFSVRVANKPFSLDHLEDAKKHLTGREVLIDSQTKEVNCTDFVSMFEDQYPSNPWRTVEAEIFTVIQSLFGAVSGKAPPCGVRHDDQSRAIYTVSFVLKWDKSECENDDRGRMKIKPVLTWVDNGRHLYGVNKTLQRPIFNHCLAALFLEDTDAGNVIIL